MAVDLVNTGVGLLGGPITSSGTVSLRPPASGNIGGVKAGANIVIAADGTISVPPATTLSLGVVRIGSGLSINAGGIVSTVNNGTVTSVTAGIGLGAPATGNIITTSGAIRLLPPSSDGSTIGGVKAGSNISIEIDGEISTEGLLQTNNPYAYNSYIWPATTTPIPAAPGENGQVLTLKDKVTGEIGWTTTGSIDGVTAGTGISVTTTAGVATVSLATGTLTPATVGATGLIPTFAVNAYGQITSYGLANPYSPFQIASTSVPAVLTLNFADNNTTWEWTLQNNTTIQTPSNSQTGQRGALLLRQNPISPYAVTWHTDWKFANATPYGGNPVAAAVDLIEFTVVAPNYIVVTNIVQNIG